MDRRTLRGGSHDQMLLSLFGEASLSLNRVVDAAQEVVHATLVEAGVGLALMRRTALCARPIRQFAP